MNNFWLVFKTNLLNTLNLNKLKSKSKNGKISPWMFILVIFLVGLSFGISFFYLSIFGDVFAKSGQPQMILSLGISFGFLFTFIVTLSNANSYIFRSRDFDLLMSLPIKSTVIVASKFAYLLLINFISFAMIYIPALVVYAIYNSTTVIFWILGILTFFILPMLPIALGSLLAFLFSFIAPRFRYKNLFTILLTLLFVFFIMYLSFNAQMLEENPSGFTLMMNNILKKTGQLAFEGIHGNYSKYVIFIAISIIPFLLFIFLIGDGYLYANSRNNSQYVNRKFKISSFKSTNQNKALIYKEIKRYFNSYIYVVNTIIGPIMSTGVLLLMYFSPSSLMEDIGVILGENSPLGLFLTAGYCFTYSITTTTSSSISIEGKQFWILKSAPLTPKQVFNAKIFVNFLITIPFIVLNTILSALIFPINLKVFDLLFMFLIPVLIVIFMSFTGLFINLLIPRFDYDSDVKAVKQSLSVLLTMVAGFAIVGIVIGLGILGYNLGENLMSYLLAFIGITTFAIISIILIYTKGIKLYNRLHG